MGDQISSSLKVEIERHADRYIEMLEKAERFGFKDYCETMVEDLFFTAPNGASVYIPPKIKKRLNERGYFTVSYGAGDVGALLLFGGRFYIRISREPITLWQNSLQK